MASMMFERVVPAGKDAYFPLQFSESGLTPTASVYEVNDATSGSAHSTISGTVVELAGGLYALKVANNNMTSGKLYYATVAAGEQVVRIQTWAYDPQDHLGDVLSAMGATGAGGLFNDSTNLYDETKKVQDEIGDISAQTFASAGGTVDSVATALKEIYDDARAASLDAAKIGDNTDAASTSGSLFAAIKQVLSDVSTETNAIDSALTTIDTEVGDIQSDLTTLSNEIGDISNVSYTNLGTAPATVAAALAEIHNRVVTDTGDIDSTLSTMDGKLDTISGNVDDIEGMLGALGDAAAADYGTDKKLMAMVRKLGADIGLVYGKVDTEVEDIKTAVGADNDAAAGGYASGSLHAKLRRLGDLAEGSNGFANIKTDAAAARSAAEETNGYLEEGGRIDNLIDGVDGKAQNVLDRVGVDGSTTLHGKLGDNADVSSDATVFGKIAAMIAKVDALQTGANARLIPSAPELIYAGSSVTYARIAVQVRDGVSGMVDEPDSELGATSSDNSHTGHVAVRVYEDGTEITASSNNRVYQDSGSTALAAATLTSANANALFDGWHLMKRVSTGVFEIFLKIPAGHNGNLQFDFEAVDSDPSAVASRFYASRSLTIRNAVAPLGQFGSF